MRLTRISFSNFKSYKQQKLSLENLNVIIGANGSGKTNFLTVFSFLQNLAEYGIENAIEILGGSSYLLNNTIGTSENLKLSFTMKSTNSIAILENRLHERNKDIKCDLYDIKYSFELSFTYRDFEIQTEIVDISFKYYEKDINSYEDYIKLGIGKIRLERDNKEINVTKDFSNIKEIKDIDFSSRIYPCELGNKTLILDEGRAFSGLMIIVKNYLRKIPVFDFNYNSMMKSTDSSISDLKSDGSNLFQKLSDIIQMKTRKNSFLNLLRYLLPFISDIETTKTIDQSSKINIIEYYNKAIPMPINTMSQGTLMILALVSSLYFEERDILIYDAFEKSIHASLISKLLEIIIEKSEKTQIIITTHNPVVLKSIDISNLFLVTRDKEGFSRIIKPHENKMVKDFLKSDIGLDDLFIDNLLE